MNSVVMCKPYVMYCNGTKITVVMCKQCVMCCTGTKYRLIDRLTYVKNTRHENKRMWIVVTRECGIILYCVRLCGVLYKCKRKSGFLSTYTHIS